MTHDLEGVRLVIPRPPADWFGGYDLRTSDVMTRQLENRGAVIIRFDTLAITQNDTAALIRQISELRAFRPHAAVAFPNAGYVMMCRVPMAGREANIFAELLAIPCILIWDHGLFQFPTLFLGHLPELPENSKGGALAHLRDTVNHPLFHHLPLDAGEVEVMMNLGILEKPPTMITPAMTQPPFVQYGMDNPAPSLHADNVAFAGNIYAERIKAFPFRRIHELEQICSNMLDGKRSDFSAPLWHLMMQEIERLTEPKRQSLSLNPDQTFFWRFAHDVIMDIGNTQLRLDMLSSIKHQVAYYGNFADPKSTGALAGLDNVSYKGWADFEMELPQVYALAKIHVDLVNTGFLACASSKAMNCFAAGGFALLDAKEDFTRLAGEASKAISYTDFDDLNAKIDIYLSNPQLREEVRHHFQEFARQLDYVNIWVQAIRQILNMDNGTAPGLVTFQAPTQ
ncbi:conserved hypothetical protein [Rhodospirillaceae bacterium LM-1]|nr:conserved hypothetical protein [Rhodospirillaceae bacterium LM-1]